MTYASVDEHRAEPPEVAFETGRGGIADEIRELGFILWDNKATVALVAAGTVLLALLYIWTATVLYTSHADLLIDPRSRQTVDREVTPTGLGASAAGADTLLLESQVEILRSQGVLDALIRSENLADDPEFAGGESGGLVGTVKTLVKTVIYGPQVGHWTGQSAYDRTVRTLRKRIDVERQRNTYVIRVTVKSGNAEKAARLANRIAEIYVADVNAAASKSTGEAAGVLSTKLDEMRERLNEAASKVEDYRRRNNLIGTRETLVVEQQLADLNRDLSAARSQVQSSRAQLNQLRALVENRSGADLKGTDGADSAAVQQLQTSLDETESRLAELRLTYAARHPILRRAQERKTALEAALRREFRRILERRNVEFKTAQERANSLEADLKRLKDSMAATNESGVELRELEREAASIRAVYEGFLRRSKEAQEQIDLPSSTARVISLAYPASRPSDPPAMLLLIGSIGLGLGLGIVAAFLHHGLWGPRYEDEVEYEDVPLEEDEEIEYV